ncbi:MAG: hypothetical protein U9P50_00305 [Patescibacteria group bacterium]|nr:hypothetical protein [Patescibacteria group bacterium]
MAEIQRNEQTQQQMATIPPQYSYQKIGDVGTTAETITFPSPTESILIENTHATQNLYVYFPSAVGVFNSHYKTIAAGYVYTKTIRLISFKIKGQAVNTGYEIDATLE